MNVLYILGNGFDKAQNLKTSYPEFYDYLEKQEGSVLLQELKSSIKRDKKLWSDMEEAFGEFTSEINTEEAFTDLYFELSGHLQTYLALENNKFTPSDELKNKFQADFVAFSRYLGELDKMRYSNFTALFRNTNVEINVMTLNYTFVLENLLSIKNRESNVEKTLGGSRILHNIVHVHGVLEDTIIIGVDNEQQIANQDFQMNENVKDLLIKFQSNHAMKLLRHENCEAYIKNANLIILYGVSLGNTDLRWWNLIGQELKKRNNLAIIQHLHYANSIRATQRQLLARIERNHQNTFMQKVGIKPDEWTQKITDRLFFTVNSNIFKK